jgi:diguanylate cyclase (GGDEF)-like protein
MPSSDATCLGDVGFSSEQKRAKAPHASACDGNAKQENEAELTTIASAGLSSQQLKGDISTLQLHRAGRERRPMITNNARILLVDDEERNRDMLGRRLERAGYEVIYRADALSIETDIVDERIDAVILDWMMPQRSGLDALRGLRRCHDGERTPVIVATALDDDEIVAEVLEAGASDYVSKPIHMRVLLARLKVQLEKRNAVLALDVVRDGLEDAVRERTRELRAEMAEREAAEERARAMALHDALTGLPNRRHLHKALEDYLSRAQSTNPLAVVAVDLDRFKPVNDLYGHAVGDELLVRIADLLRHEIGDDGFAARLGGDEFILVLPYASEEQLLGRLTELVAKFETPFPLLGYEVSVGATLGVAMAPTDGADSDTLMRRADVALYRAKEDGRGRFAFFEPGMDERVHERAALENDLRIAIRNEIIEPYFQPLVQLETSQVLGYEILARWPHPERGLIPPDQFIHVAEETGLIGELTLNILGRACRESLNWPGAPRISLNISPVQLRDAALPQKLLAILAQNGFPPQRLEVEITENALVSDFEAARLILISLKNQGVHIALDDFGTGYSSLRHLRELPFDVLKIDRSFVHSMTDSEDAHTLVKTIVALAKNLGLGVTAEGIESVEHAEALQALGCELGQGFLYGRAVNGADTAEGLEHPATPVSKSSAA